MTTTVKCANCDGCGKAGKTRTECPQCSGRGVVKIKKSDIHRTNKLMLVAYIVAGLIIFSLGHFTATPVGEFLGMNSLQIKITRLLVESIPYTIIGTFGVWTFWAVVFKTPDIT